DVLPARPHHRAGRQHAALREQPVVARDVLRRGRRRTEARAQGADQGQDAALHEPVQPWHRRQFAGARQLGQHLAAVHVHRVGELVLPLDDPDDHPDCRHGAERAAHQEDSAHRRLDGRVRDPGLPAAPDLRRPAQHGAERHDRSRVRAVQQLHDHRPGDHPIQADGHVHVRQRHRIRLRDLDGVQHRVHAVLRPCDRLRRPRDRLVGRQLHQQTVAAAGDYRGSRRRPGRCPGRRAGGGLVTEAIAIVGMACRYPDASNPDELWANVLTGRRAFRQLPDERMRLADYWSPDPAAPDRFYSRNAAVIEGFDFDRVHFKIAGSTYRATDLTHWLALDTASRALADAGFADGDGLPRQSTAVIIGNTLTGEFARANLMRLRWPYVRRVVSAALREHGWGDGDLAEFMRDLEGRYKTPFPPIDEDSLAGGLANTIAG